MALDQVEDVVIEADGVFKYILIELIEPAKNDKPERTKTVVRGFEWAEFHADILDRVAPKFSELRLDYDCVGGGRIQHDSKNQKIRIYGYSVGFGLANHKVTQELLYRKYSYPDGNITWSNAGY